MNRIILIGNGFDLAHGIETSYNDFITDYWKNTIEEIKSKEPNSGFENPEIIINQVPNNWVEGYGFDALTNSLENQPYNLKYKNKFLRIITSKKQAQNWVDIENEYYSLLKNSFKDKNTSYTINELNKDFNRIQILLEDYLKKAEDQFKDQIATSLKSAKIKSNIGYKIYSDFKLKDFTESSINRMAEVENSKIQKEMKKILNNEIKLTDLEDRKRNLIPKISGREQPVNEIRKLLISGIAPNYFYLYPEEFLFLNFNYTFTEKIYSNHKEFETYEPINGLTKKTIHIHGTTDKYDNNDVIFGFGDEIDEDYKAIENLHNNDYLENIKSIKYLETDNYKQLLEFINSGDYQICIFGHSCGITDRTLLNTLFEHKNCSSIKPYYHKRGDGTDNYSDLIRNISRHFNNKAIMRDKVVNKKYCEPLL